MNFDFGGGRRAANKFGYWGKSFHEKNIDAL